MFTLAQLHDDFMDDWSINIFMQEENENDHISFPVSLSISKL